MTCLLETLLSWPRVDVDPLRTRDEWRQARQWGWVMESGELTGTGAGHAHTLPDGLVSNDR